MKSRSEPSQLDLDSKRDQVRESFCMIVVTDENCGEEMVGNRRHFSVRPWKNLFVPMRHRVEEALVEKHFPSGSSSISPCLLMIV